MKISYKNFEYATSIFFYDVFKKPKMTFTCKYFAIQGPSVRYAESLTFFQKDLVSCFDQIL